MFEKIIIPFCLKNRYIGYKLLGKGAQATTYYGKCLLTKKSITIKSNKHFNSNFYNEYNILDKLNQENKNNKYIPKPLDFITDNLGNEHIVTEHIYGCDLFQYMEHQNFQPHINFQDTKNMIINILECVDFLHTNNVAHLDIKPENIIIQNNSRVRLIDFGSAHLINKSSQNLHPSEKLVGTTDYASPEIMNDYFHNKSDIWSIGIVFYLLCTGTLPEKLPVDIRFMPEISHLINSMLENNWKKRLSCHEVINCLLDL